MNDNLVSYFIYLGQCIIGTLVLDFGSRLCFMPFIFKFSQFLFVM